MQKKSFYRLDFVYLKDMTERSHVNLRCDYWADSSSLILCWGTDDSIIFIRHSDILRNTKNENPDKTSPSKEITYHDAEYEPFKNDKGKFDVSQVFILPRRNSEVSQTFDLLPE